ncbi:MAG: hypothetical protein GY807_19730 [Gammaproteobacteria bacterium]|nr:hypothetical protein [Gammaproteobacteria bacterium]
MFKDSNFKLQASRQPTHSHDQQKSQYQLHDGDKVLILGGGPAGCSAAMYIKKMKPTLQVIVLDNRNDKAMSTGGPGSCKGCVGGISGFLLDQLKTDFNITLPRCLVNNQINSVKFINLLDKHHETHFEIDIANDLTEIWDPPKMGSVLVSVGNGKGKYNHPDGKNISFDYFLRTTAKEMGVEFINGYVNTIQMPKDSIDGVKIHFTPKRLKSTFIWYKKDKHGKVSVAPNKQNENRKEINDAALVVNATGINSRNRIEIGYYDTEDDTFRPAPAKRATGKIMGMFDIDIEQKYLQENFGNTIRIYGGIKGTNTIVAAPKYLQKGGSWLTIAILLDRDIEPEYDNSCDDGNCSKSIPHKFRKEMKSIRDDFLHKSGVGKHLRLQNIKKSTCRCTPIIPHTVSEKPYGNRYIEVGDSSGAMKYGRNGIPYAFNSAKRAMEVAVSIGISEKDFKTHYDKTFVAPIRRDNQLGKYILKWNGFINRHIALASAYYEIANESPLLKRYAIQILLGIRSSDTYTQSTLRILKDSYGGLSLLFVFFKWYARNRFGKFLEERSNKVQKIGAHKLDGHQTHRQES